MGRSKDIEREWKVHGKLKRCALVDRQQQRYFIFLSLYMKREHPHYEIRMEVARPISGCEATLIRGMWLYRVVNV